ncbi:MAG: amidohydrolase family protein [Clostridiales bacterium]|nr:amidohydrolase family protein [Clostridiales bacterium]
MIFANHAHVFPKEIKESGTVERLLDFLDECEIDKAVCFAPFSDRLKECGYSETPNRFLAGVINGNERLTGFGTVDFTGDVEEQVREIAGLGLKGIKMHPPYQEFRIDGPEAFKVYEKACEYNLFISFHSGMHWHRLRDNRVILFDEVAWNFPNLKFSLEHIGGYHFFKEALAVMCNNSRNGNNVYAGWTTIRDSKGPTQWALSDEQLLTVILQTGENNSIFGIDFPYCKAEDIKSDIRRIKSLDISDECKENILGKTLENVLNR